MRLICEPSDYPFTSAGMDASANEVDSSDISCDESFETEYSIAGSSCDNEEFSCGYLGEPELQNNKLNQLNLVLRAAVHSDDDQLNSSRLENLHWCTCHHCIVMPTFIECKCCEELIC